MWRYFLPGVGQWQASVASSIDGRAYAVGPGSVDWYRAQAYETNRWVMLTHTSFGAICLVIGVLQFLPATRRQPRLHRWFGRAFVLTMTVAMLSAMLFLALAGVAHFALAPALWLQLWVLGLSTMSTGWIAVAMIRRHDLIAHQGFMMLCFAFLMTAPGLRVLWVAFHPLFPRLVLVDNLVGAAVAETVLAPTLGVAAFIWSQSDNRSAWQPRSHLAAFPVRLASVTITAAHYFATVPSSTPIQLLWTYLVPYISTLTTCLIFATRSRQQARWSEAHRWRTLCDGIVLSGLATNATWFVSAAMTSQTNAFLASVLVTTGIPITLAGVSIIKDAAAAA